MLQLLACAGIVGAGAGMPLGGGGWGEQEDLSLVVFRSTDKEKRQGIRWATVDLVPAGQVAFELAPAKVIGRCQLGK